MTNIGSFGVERPRVDLSFDYFGTEIRVHPDASDLKIMDMMLSIGELDMDDENNATAIIDALREQLFGQIHPDDQAEFWRLAKENRQTRLDLMAVTKAITEAVAGFPTQSPSDYSPTQRPDDTRSEQDSPSRQQRRALERKAGKGNTAAALTLLQGRPDLQKVVADRAEWLDSETG